jgi:hypothetical protein
MSTAPNDRYFVAALEATRAEQAHRQILAASIGIGLHADALGRATFPGDLAGDVEAICRKLAEAIVDLDRIAGRVVE